MNRLTESNDTELSKELRSALALAVSFMEKHRLTKLIITKNGFDVDIETEPNILRTDIQDDRDLPSM